MSDVTQILSQIESGDPTAADHLLPIIYAELRTLAAALLSHERPGQTLTATALVHEAYVRLVDVQQAQHWNSTGHFYRAAAEAMRRILIERAREKGRLKRGGHLTRRVLEMNEPHVLDPDVDLLAVDEALKKLAEKHPEKAELVLLRYFAGLTISQAAETLTVSTATAERYWKYARAWLARELRRGDERET